MSLRQRTVLRVVVAGVLLVFLLYHFQQTGLFTKDKALFSGICLVAMGVLSFFFRAKFDKAVPDLQERLTPVWGYGIPKRAQNVTYYLILALGVGLIIWSQCPAP